MASGGAQLSDLRPLDPSGRLYADRIGTHRRESEHLNVRNAQPGFVYHYGKRKSARIQALIRRGYKVVTADDPESKGLASDENLRAAGLDTSQLSGDVVLLKCPEHLVRDRRAQKIAAAKASLMGATDEFLGSGDAGERHYNFPDKPLRFKSPKHRIDEQETFE